MSKRLSGCNQGWDPRSASQFPTLLHVRWMAEYYCCVTRPSTRLSGQMRLRMRCDAMRCLLPNFPPTACRWRRVGVGCTGSKKAHDRAAASLLPSWGKWPITFWRHLWITLSEPRVWPAWPACSSTVHQTGPCTVEYAGAALGRGESASDLQQTDSPRTPTDRIPTSDLPTSHRWV